MCPNECTAIHGHGRAIFRKTNENTGVDKWQIPTDLHHLFADTKYWMEHNTYLPDEIAIRFKHRIVSIHCFSKGNGRHSRLMADIIIERLFGQPVFTWCAANLIQQYDTRSAYLAAVRSADAGDINPLITFARS